MSRSKLRNKWMRKRYEENCKENGKHSVHQQDECPKNRPSKYITNRCANVGWLQEPVNFGSHKPRRGGHRMVSGIVRAKVKEEIRKQIEDGQD